MKPGVDYIGVSVGVLVLNGKGEILLTKRGRRATNERGTWEIPGGKVMFGEALIHAAEREIREEYGIEIDIFFQFPARDHFIPEEKQHWVPTCFLARLRKGQTPEIMEPDKCDAIGWFKHDDLPVPLSIITALDMDTYRKYLSHTDVNMV